VARARFSASAPRAFAFDGARTTKDASSMRDI
jgi:hypothetical protein